MGYRRFVKVGVCDVIYGEYVVGKDLKCFFLYFFMFESVKKFVYDLGVWFDIKFVFGCFV